MLKGALCAAALIAGLSLTPAAASAATIIGGGTAIDLTATNSFQSLGYTLATYGTSSAVTNAAGDIVATFLVTGGSRNDSTSALLVQHAGSGLNFTSGVNTLSIGNFEIDTAAGVVRGAATANGSALGVMPLFTLGANMSLLLTNEAATAFTTTLGAPNLAGTNIGTADSNIVFASGVPEPANWALLIGGVGLVGATLRRRSARADRAAIA